MIKKDINQIEVFNNLFSKENYVTLISHLYLYKKVEHLVRPKYKNFKNVLFIHISMFCLFFLEK